MGKPVIDSFYVALRLINRLIDLIFDIILAETRDCKYWIFEHENL